MSETRQPSRVLLIAAGVLTQLTGGACLVLGLSSLPIANDLHTGTHALIATIVAALAAIACGTLMFRGRLVPIALAAGLDVGFGIGLSRGGSAIGSLLRILPASDAATAKTAVTVGALVMFLAAMLCVVAIPSALALRRWAHLERAREGRGGAGIPQTLRGPGTPLKPTQVVRAVDGPSRAKPLLILGIALSLIALGVVVITAASGSKPAAPAFAVHPGSSAAGSGSAATHVAVTMPTTSTGSAMPAMTDAAVIENGDAAVTPAPVVASVVASIDDFVTTWHAALSHATARELGPLFDAKVFGFGVEAHEVGEGRDAVVAMVRHDLGEPPSGGFKVEPRFAQIGRDGEIAWIAEELRVGARTFVATVVVGLHAGAWTIAAVHWATSMANESAYRLGRDGELAVPDAIPDSHDVSPLGVAMRTAFASKPSFVEARSTRADAFNFGSAPGERIGGGEAIRKTFARIRATIHLHDAIKVGTIGERGGWGAANVDFTDADRDGTDVTQIFRVLAAWVREGAGWRIVQTQWSNAR